jgi:hypothetical protein
MTKLYAVSQKEIDFSSQLRNAVLNKIKKSSWDNRFIAERLELLPSGVQVLLDRDSWPVETAIRIATALDISLSIRLPDND